MKVAILGCGNRGGVYARHLHEMGATVSHLTDTDPARLALVARRYGLEPTQCFSDWHAFFDLGRVADAVVIATPDDRHVQPCLRALELGYHVLLEKPICLEEIDLDRLLAAEQASSGSVTVAHVLRSTPFFLAIRQLVASGELGRLVGVNHSENVAFWHYAHSYVRGNWRQSPPAAPFMLAKSSHDLDLLRWFADSPPVWIMADGAQHHFRPEDRPAGAAERCLDCPVQACPADARRIYLNRAPDVWPNTVLTGSGTPEGVLSALRDGPYGLCAYRGGNDQPDYLNALIHFQNGVQTTVSVSAFTHDNTRTLRLMFTGGEIRGQMELGELEIHHYGNGTVDRRSVAADGNHGGGDTGLVNGWLAFLRGAAAQPTPLAESLDSHRLAFAAERSRRGNSVQIVNVGTPNGPGRA